MRRRELGRNAWTGSIKRKGEMFKLGGAGAALDSTVSKAIKRFQLVGKA